MAMAMAMANYATIIAVEWSGVAAKRGWGSWRQLELLINFINAKEMQQ